jgi:TPR repeat protein
MRLFVLAAFAAGVIVGGGTMHFANYDELAEVSRLRAENGSLKNFAFGPLASVLTPLPPRSPANVDPNQRVSTLLPDRARSFWNIGSEARNRNQHPEAVYWYKQALRLCESDSLTFLADAYLHGEIGGSPDVTTGFQLMRCASALGNETARDQLARLLKGRSIPYAPPEASDQYQRAR